MNFNVVESVVENMVGQVSSFMFKNISTGVPLWLGFWWKKRYDFLLLALEMNKTVDFSFYFILEKKCK